MQKFTSRKFLSAVMAAFTGISLIIGGQTDAETISGAVLSVAALIVYILTEGHIDTAAVKATGTTTEGEPAAIVGEP